MEIRCLVSLSLVFGITRHFLDRKSGIIENRGTSDYSYKKLKKLRSENFSENSLSRFSIYVNNYLSTRRNRGKIGSIAT